MPREPYPILFRGAVLITIVFPAPSFAHRIHRALNKCFFLALINEGMHARVVLDCFLPQFSVSKAWGLFGSSNSRGFILLDCGGPGSRQGAPAKMG